MASPTTPPDTDATSAAITRRDLLFVLLLTLLALAVRWAIATRGGLWRDEGLFLGIVRFPSVAEILVYLREHESHPPLFYLLMRGWLRLFGDTERAALALPVLLGAAMIPSLYAVGARVFGRVTGLTAALLAVPASSLAGNAAYARPYSLLPLLCLWSLFLLWCALSEESATRLRAWAGYVATTLALVYTHNWSWLVVAGTWVAVTLYLLSSGAGQKRRTALVGWLIAQAILAAGYAPWASALGQQFRHAGHGSPLQPSTPGDIFDHLFTTITRSLLRGVQSLC